KRILYSKIEDFKYQLEEDPEVMDLNIPTNISEMIRQEDADCNIFATVVDTTKSSGFFTCQILCPSKADPRIVIHCTQKRFKKRQCKLKIRWMVIGYDINFNYKFLDHNYQLDVRKSDVSVNASTKFYNKSLDIMPVTTKRNLFVGIPTLSTLDSSNKRLIIGHHFVNTQGNKTQAYVFSYCSEKNSYDNLPSFTFYTLVISNYNNPKTYGTLQFKNSYLFKKPYIEFCKDSLKPKYVSLCSMEENKNGPIFLKQTIYKIRIKDINCKSKDCIICINKPLKISKEDFSCYFFDPHERLNLN
ncbi:10077_t:CDS:2, partial [Funneliformis geosporum]